MDRPLVFQGNVATAGGCLSALYLVGWLVESWFDVDKHLDFRISVLCADEAEPDGSRQLVFSTVVHCHNRLGRAYILVIAPFHRWVVKASLVRAARVGWPLAGCP